MRVALRLCQEEPLRSFIDQNDRTPELDHSLLNADDATLAKEVRVRAETIYHPTSTARIGSVVDAQLRVYGLERIRIADCSVIPTIISGHTVCLLFSMSGFKFLTMAEIGSLCPGHWGKGR
jgi:choline dehydrogenase